MQMGVWNVNVEEYYLVRILKLDLRRQSQDHPMVGGGGRIGGMV